MTFVPVRPPNVLVMEHLGGELPDSLSVPMIGEGAARFTRH